MALLPMSRPDPPEHPEDDEPLFALKNLRHSDVSSLASKIAQHVGSENSHELALDLVLNEIVEQARLATMATGAAIALFRGDEMVCRATSGSSAPDLGVRLNTRTGLSGACVRTREVQRCDDTEKDPRVDGNALRNLDVRSILVVPIVERNDLVGIFEILSPRVSAFSDRDVQTLEALSLRIVRTIESAASEPESVEEILIPEVSLEPEISSEPLLPVPPAADEAGAVGDQWTNILTAVVIALALLLGWMVGYAGWRRATAPRVVATVVPAKPAEQTATQEAAKTPVPAIQEEKTKPAANPRPAAAKTATSVPGGLVVYQNGKVVFTLPADPTAASTVKTASDVTPVIAPEVAATYLRYRVEPEYPAAARETQALGPVILKVYVGKDGLVQQANVVSGDPLLVASAVAAVRQWKYEPYSPDGVPVDFSTEVTVNFKGQ